MGAEEPLPLILHSSDRGDHPILSQTVTRASLKRIYVNALISVRMKLWS